MIFSLIGLLHESRSCTPITSPESHQGRLQHQRHYKIARLNSSTNKANSNPAPGDEAKDVASHDNEALAAASPPHGRHLKNPHTTA